MNIHYYLILYPMEAMIASQLDPETFGAYMAVGNQKGSSERLMFIEAGESGLGSVFDLDYAKNRCVPHEDGRPKNSVYLSVYRALENVPKDCLGRLWLVTRDGRSLALERGPYTSPQDHQHESLYQELCPASPLVVSHLEPRKYGEYIVGETDKVTMPAVFFADLALPNTDNSEHTGNVGGYFTGILEHLKSCTEDLKVEGDKKSKVVDRSAAARFGYQVIGRGLYVAGSGGDLVCYAMPSRAELKKDHYDWARSALIF